MFVSYVKTMTCYNGAKQYLIGLKLEKWCFRGKKVFWRCFISNTVIIFLSTLNFLMQIIFFCGEEHFGFDILVWCFWNCLNSMLLFLIFSFCLFFLSSLSFTFVYVLCGMLRTPVRELLQNITSNIFDFRIVLQVFELIQIQNITFKIW